MMINTLLRTLFLGGACLTVTPACAQSIPPSKHYIAIEVMLPDEGERDAGIFYPPGTTIEVLDGNNQAVAPSILVPDIYMYKGQIQLKVFPAYRKTSPDLYPLREQQIIVFTKTLYSEATHTQHKEESRAH